MSVSLGRINSPTGVVMVVDPGYMNLWSHTRPPVMPAYMLESKEAVEVANRAVDLKISGPQAEKAGLLFDRSIHPLYLFDVPEHGVAEMKKWFQETTSKHHLIADLNVLPSRIPHRLRADLTLERGRAGEMQFHGIWSCVISGVPAGRPLEVIAEPMPKGPDEGRWRRITIVCSSEAIVDVMEAGSVMVDFGCLMIADLDSLDGWVSDKSRDGLADFTFWGKDAAAVARAAGAPDLGDGTYGWRDKPMDTVSALAATVRDLQKEHDWKFGANFAVHDHWHELTRQIESNRSESGLVTIAGATACGFRNTWGDGIFDVFLDLDSSARLVAIRIELGTPERVQLMRSVETRSKLAMVTKLVADEREPVRWAYRETPDQENDSGWRMFAGTESDEYSNDSKNVSLVTVSTLLERDPRLKKIIDAPPGCAFERSGPTEDFRAVDWQPPNE